MGVEYLMRRDNRNMKDLSEDLLVVVVTLVISGVVLLIAGII